MKIVSPATERLLAEVPEDTPETVVAHFAVARRGQPAWAATPIARRLDAIRRFAELLVSRQGELAVTLTREMGKPITQSERELSAMGGRIEFFLTETERRLCDETVHEGGGIVEKIAYEPLGVVANVSAWNYPYFVGSNVFVPALLTGNAVLYKPSELATLTGLSIGRLLGEAGVPADVFRTIVGAGDVGRAVAASPVDGIFFTGSYATGKRIAEAEGGRLTKMQLELGGKDPTYVCEDVDVSVAAESLADGAFYNTGQSCCSVERIYVHAAIARPFVDAFLTTVRGFVVGDPEDHATYIGPLARAAQADVLEAQVSDAIAKGARLLCGGRRLPGPGFYFEPTVLVDVKGSMRVMREESFGPIIGIEVVRGDDEAVDRMNDTAYGLTAGVYSRDRARAEAILRQVDAGSVYWNCCD